MILFVVMAPGKELNDSLRAKIQSKIKSDLSPRYLPDTIIQAPAVPKTLNGKKLEVPVKKVLLGADPSTVLNRDSVSDPSSMEYYVSLGKRGGAGKV